MKIKAGDLTPEGAYHLLNSIVAPRPIAWISTTASDGRDNLAPFSYFNVVCSDPPTLCVSIGRKPDQTLKDTAANLLATKRATVHIVPQALAQKMVDTSTATNEDEFDLAALEKTPGQAGYPPHITGAPIAMEATLAAHQEIGNKPVDFFLLEVQRFILDDAVTTDNLVDPKKLTVTGRLGGSSYCAVDTIFNLLRPKA